MKFALAALFCVLSLTMAAAQSTAPAQSNNDTGDVATADGLWDGRLKGGNYVVRGNAIIALSKHEYVSDGVARVVEVNVTLNSATVVRFYYLEPISLEGGGVIGAGQSALDRMRTVAEQTANRVSPTLTEPKAVKNYPTSTHAHTVEFVLKEEARLNSLYDSLHRTFRTGQGRIWRE